MACGYSYDEPDYDEWRNEFDIEDSDLARNWFNCPDEERSSFMSDDKDWFKRI